MILRHFYPISVPHALLALSWENWRAPVIPIKNIPLSLKSPRYSTGIWETEKEERTQLILTRNTQTQQPGIKFYPPQQTKSFFWINLRDTHTAKGRNIGKKIFYSCPENRP